MRLLLLLLLSVSFVGCTAVKFKSGYGEVKDYDFSKPITELEAANPEISTYSVFNNDYPYVTMESIYKKWGRPETTQIGWNEIGIRTAIVVAFGASGLLTYPWALGIQLLEGGAPCEFEEWMKGDKKIRVEACPEWMNRKALVRSWEWTQIN